MPPTAHDAGKMTCGAVAHVRVSACCPLSPGTAPLTYSKDYMRVRRVPGSTCSSGEPPAQRLRSACTGGSQVFSGNWRLLLRPGPAVLTCREGVDNSCLSALSSVLSADLGPGSSFPFESFGLWVGRDQGAVRIRLLASSLDNVSMPDAAVAISRPDPAREFSDRAAPASARMCSEASERDRDKDSWVASQVGRARNRRVGRFVSDRRHRCFITWRHGVDAICELELPLLRLCIYLIFRPSVSHGP